MRFIRTFALLAGTALLFAACSKEADETAVVTANTNPLLAYVPADTAYVFATLDPVPDAITDAYVQRFQPVLDVMSEQISQFKTDYDAGVYEGHEQARVAKAVLNELGGELNVENLAKLGISMRAQHAIYAMGVFPVIRIELSDSQALRATIDRIEAEMGFEIPEKELNGTQYWSITDTGSKGGVYIAIMDQHLAFSVFPVSADDRMLAAFLGQEMPAQSMASSNALAIMNSQKGYTAYGSGILDLQTLVDEMLNPNSVTNTYLERYWGFDPAELNATCVAEIQSIVAKAPRMTAGTTELTANEISVRYELELESTLAGSLINLVSNVPVAVEGDNLFSASLALKVGKLRSFLLEKANAIVASPYQCEELQHMNRHAGELVAQLNIPMPPMVNNLLGLRVRMDDLDPHGDIPKGEGVLALYVDKPEMFVGMASMMVPGFDTLDLANQSEPVRIPPEMLPMPDIELYALMGEQTIGISIGENYATELDQFLDTKPQENGTFFSVSYDMARQMELQAALSKKYDFDVDHHRSQAHEFSEAFKDSYTAMLGRSRMDMRFTADGLTIDSKLSFK